MIVVGVLSNIHLQKCVNNQINVSVVSSSNKAPLNKMDFRGWFIAVNGVKGIMNLFVL